MTPMRAFVLAVVLWSTVVLGVVLFYPAEHADLLACMRHVGRSIACEAQQDDINQLWREYRTLPLLMGFAAGYIGIGFLAAVGAWRRHQVNGR